MLTRTFCAKLKPIRQNGIKHLSYAAWEDLELTRA
jgi:hypothetical protein